MKRFNNAIAILVLLFAGLISAIPTQAAVVKGMRSWHSPDGSRLVFDIDRPVTYKVFALNNPARVVVDFKDSRFLAKPPLDKSEFSVIRYIRNGQHDKSTYRVVIEVNESVKANAFQLAPNAQYGQRLVVDLNRINKRPETHVAKATPPPTTNTTGSGIAPGKRDLVIAIDAGHGGEDPGAIGKRGTREKDVVLSIAKKLVERINRHPRMRAVLIRKGDYYVGLGRRTILARESGADMFVSIHADAVENRSVQGSSVYALSDKRATSEIAKTLADKENAADLVGGISIADKDDDVAGLILDLAMDNTKHQSIVFAKDVLYEMQRVGPVLRNNIERASFAVLKSPDIPSVLVETAFISNPSEEKKLNSAQFQNQIADAVFKGISRYAERDGFRVLAGD